MAIIAFCIAQLCFAQSLDSAVHSIDDEKRIHIIVGMGSRPPFLDIHGEQGAGPDVLNALNQAQEHFYFKHKYIPTKRKVKMVEEGWIDIMMWDNRSWSWESSNVSSSAALVHSKDIFIALKERAQTEQFFDSLENKSISVVRGYHYQFLDFDTNFEKFSDKYKIASVRTEEAVIKMVLAGRAHVGVVSDTSLSWFLIRYPEYQTKIIQSEKIDKFYSRHFVIPNQSVLTANELNDILKAADQKGLLSPIYQRYGLNKPDFNVISK